MYSTEEKYLIELLSYKKSMLNEDKIFSVIKDILSETKKTV